MKKKVKRVETRRVAEGGLLYKWQQLCDTGAPVSMVLLLLFVVTASLVLCLGQGIIVGPGLGMGLLARQFVGGGTVLLLLSVAMGFYLSAFEPRMLKDHLATAILLLLMLAMIAGMHLITVVGWSPHLVVAPVLMLTIMLTIGYSQRFALGMGAFGAISSTLIVKGDALGVFLGAAAGMGVAVLLLKEIRSRSKLIEVCVYSGVVIAVMNLAVGLWHWPERTWSQVLTDSLWGGGGAVAVGFFMQGLLPLVEKLFGSATAMTLRDWGEANQPILRRLAVAAPGTFNHCWQIGMLSEAAAEAIGANALLCRVGSYYHDIGKVNKPHYFVENQAESFNQHRELEPTMSRIIIIGHVRDGLALAKEYRVPKVLQQFIATHHGTTLVQYFYHEASKKGAELGVSVPETEFRYPGPKPWTKEAAIIMIADAVEGATRAMREPTPSRIAAVVTEISRKRLQDGQFDECDLTMRELHMIEESLVKSLCGMYHGRIAYPKMEKSDKGERPERNGSNGSNGSNGGATDSDAKSSADAAEPALKGSE